MNDAEQVKEIEKTTNHDVKAVELFLNNKFQEKDITEKHRNFIHFALTSYDTNGVANPLLFKGALENIYNSQFEQIVDKLEQLAEEWKDIPMLAHTHGQPASPTHLGKEIQVFIGRLKRQHQQLTAIPHAAKFGGATGNFNAHYVAYPNIDWNKIGDNFCDGF